MAAPIIAPAARPCVVLLSGGLDSATVLAIARRQGFACHALSFNYGQRHQIELEAARRVARTLGVSAHYCVRIDVGSFPGFQGSALTDDIAVPKDRSLEADTHIPVTYVPARNTIFLAYALALAETLKSSDIYIGVNAVDYSGYPDCRPQYIEAFERMANLATKAAVEGRRLIIHVPLLHWTKTQIIQHGLELGVDYSQTHSCYDPQRGETQGDTATLEPCGRCDACLLRQRAFTELGMEDPVRKGHGRP